jgi:lipopolysaccharide transport system permease protein
MIADVRALYAHRQLLQDFAWREIRARYKGSVLGFAWNFLNPLLQLLVYYVLFGVLLRIPVVNAMGVEPAYGYAVFLFTGLLPWTFFASALQGGANSVVNNANLVKKVRLPLQILPASSVLSSLMHFMLSLIVLAAVLVAAGVPPHATLLWVPALIGVQLVLNLGFAYVLAAAAVFFRDTLHILGIVLMLWYFLTPVIVPLETFAGRPREYFLLHLNPMTAIITGYQRAILDGVPPKLDWLLYSLGFALIALLVGLTVYRRSSDAFEEEL